MRRRQQEISFISAQTFCEHKSNLLARLYCSILENVLLAQKPEFLHQPPCYPQIDKRVYCNHGFLIPVQDSSLTKLPPPRPPFFYSMFSQSQLLGSLTNAKLEQEDPALVYCRT